MMRGPCAKRTVVCIIRVKDGPSFVGTNDCANPQDVCPRRPGEGYDKCKSICDQSGHAEIQALQMAGERARGADVLIKGHYYMCEPCGRALLDAGVDSILMVQTR